MSDTPAIIKCRIATKHRVPAVDQRLWYGSKELVNDDTLAQLGFTQRSLLVVRWSPVFATARALNGTVLTTDNSPILCSVENSGFDTFLGEWNEVSEGPQAVSFPIRGAAFAALHWARLRTQTPRPLHSA